MTWFRKRKHPLWRAYKTQSYGAKKRGIAFLLTFDEWLTIWQDSGHIHERGQGRGLYCMSRPGDAGPYAVGNVKIVEHGENISEWCKGKPISIEMRQQISRTKTGTKLSKDHRDKIVATLIGRPVSPETREKIRVGNLGKITSKETKQRISEAKRDKPWTEARRVAQNSRRQQFQP